MFLESSFVSLEDWFRPWVYLDGEASLCIICEMMEIPGLRSDRSVKRGLLSEDLMSGLRSVRKWPRSVLGGL